ncbi:MAG: Fur family transcriptional regulator [Candidatus Omnitrophota bacterium]
MELYLQALKSNRLKITPRRKAVIDLFMKQGIQMGPYDVYEKLQNRLSVIGMPTVYRILDEFTKVGILVKSLSEDRQLRYALCALPGEHHHHFTCRKCRKVEEVAFCDFNKVSKFIEKNLKAKVEAHQLQIEGLCSKCK